MTLEDTAPLHLVSQVPIPSHPRTLSSTTGKSDHRFQFLRSRRPILALQTTQRKPLPLELIPSTLSLFILCALASLRKNRFGNSSLCIPQIRFRKLDTKQHTSPPDEVLVGL